MKHSAMKRLLPGKRVRYVVVMLIAGCAAVLMTSVWRSSAVKDTDKITTNHEFHLRVRDGVGREVELPARGNSSGQIRAAVNSVATFIERRSGVRLSGATKNRLSEIEELALSGTARPLTSDELSDLITATVLERLSVLSEQEIAHVDDTLRGFKAPSLPRGFNRNFKLPGGIVFAGTPSEKTITRLKAVRDQLGTPAGDVFQGLARGFVKDRVQGRARYLSKSVPEKFGNMWDTVNDREGAAADGGITPLQAVLIAYSLASDDYLSDDEISLGRRMKSLQATATRISGEPYPDPSGHRAYGVNGYLFSSPLDVVFDEQIINRLFDGIEKKWAA
ncbi:MAG TPA: hypothetical protein VEZ40_05360 [Pyrinomonadaceae bacterium]|nr:hypothetical protein [Pyrinomonadaceae bacterium]